MLKKEVIALVTKSIEVKFEFEGFHKWKAAPEEVSFLRDLHRHTFKVTFQSNVQHSDRDLEFILVKRELQGYTKNICELLGENASCEVFAEFFLEKFFSNHEDVLWAKCKVSEDGENAGIVEYNYLP